MKIGVFTDVHYCNAEVMCKTRRPLLSPVKIREAMEAFCTESIDLCICLVPGNHDFLVLKRENFRSAGVQTPPYATSIGGYRLIFLDAKYRSDMRHFDVAGEQWTDANLPEEQCRFLESELNTAIEPCVVCIHENLDPFVEKDYIVKNADEIRGIIKGKVKMVLQGHYHEGTDNAYRIVELP